MRSAMGERNMVWVRGDAVVVEREYLRRMRRMGQQKLVQRPSLESAATEWVYITSLWRPSGRVRHTTRRPVISLPQSQPEPASAALAARLSQTRTGVGYIEERRIWTYGRNAILCDIWPEDVGDNVGIPRRSEVVLQVPVVENSQSRRIPALAPWSFVRANYGQTCSGSARARARAKRGIERG